MPSPGQMTMMSTRRWLVWLPVLMVASLLYWTVALGLGGMSLMAVSALSGNDGAGALGLSVTGGDTDTAPGLAPRDGYEPIIVHLEESVEADDVDDSGGCRAASGGGGDVGGARDRDPGDMRASSATDFSSGAALR